MIRFRYLLTVGWLAACATAAGAQSYPQYPAQYPSTQYPSSGYPSQGYPQQSYSQFAPLSDADQLAQQMRTLAADPTNVYALVNAGNLSLKLGDTDGAAALFTRAEKVSPNSPQVKAGMGRLLVNAQRPGEALRLFQEAALLGASERDFGSDRALAYDLIGDQQRAQREYRAILRRGTDDEATRRYALSLGISGIKDPALALLEPLNRRSDRGAWRVRAFVLAMNGDRPGAERIAITMMPPGMADGLRPFFDRLPRLSAVDRAFAVHFGEVRPNATRIADARRVPSLPALAPEPNPFPASATAAQVAAADTGKKSKKDKRKLVAAVNLSRTPYAAPLPPPPAPTATQLAALGATRLAPPAAAYGYAPASRGVTVLPPPADAYRSPATQLAQATVPPAVTRFTAAPVPSAADDESGDEGPDEPVAATPARVLPPVLARTAPATAAALPPVQLASTVFSLQPGTGSISAAGTPPVTASTLAPPPAAATTLAPPVAQPAAVAPAPAASVPPITSGAAPTSVAATVAPIATPAAEPAPAQTTFSTSGPPLVVPPPVGTNGDAVLAAIVANITVPDAELRDAQPAPAGALLTVVEKQADPKARAALAAATLPRERTGAKPVLDAAKLRKDGRGRFIDGQGRPLLDGRGQPMDAKAAISWLTTRDPAYAATLAKAGDDDVALPKKDARGRFVDARGRPLLDARGRPMTEKAALAWAAAQDDILAKGKADALPKKDTRGRFVDAKGKPLLDPRGRPMDARQAAAWLAAGGKSVADKKDAPEKAEPARIWVQVAGGANEDMLAKEWARAQGQSATLKGKQGWTTPLRATNRVLTGPFKTSAEAMALVNQLKKQGVSAFMFTSDPGQKIAKLGAK